jgi:hypothetical protein
MPEGVQGGGVTEDATLDAFADDEESAAAGDGSEVDVGGDVDSGGDAESGNDGPVPPTPTSSWRPGGDCAACGEHVSRRWWDGDEHVCGDCVSWDASGGDP